MSAMRKFFLASACLLASTATVRAQQPPTPAPLTSEEFSQTLSPFIDDQTLLVAHLDTARMDLSGIEAFAAEIMDAGHVPVGDQSRKQLAQGRLIADAYLSKFQSIGGRHVYYVLSHADLWPFVDGPAAILIPLKKNADPKPMLDFLHTFPDPGWSPFTIDVLPNNVIFFGTQSAEAHLKSIQPSPRPPLIAGLAASSDCTLQVVYAPTADIQRVLSEMMPSFPADSPILPGASTDFLSRGCKYVSLAVNLPPHPSATLVVATQSQQDAQQVAAFVLDGLKLIEQIPDYRQAIVDPDPDEKPGLDSLQLFLADMKTDFSAPVSGPDLTVRFDEPQIRSFFQFAAPAFEVAQKNAARQQTMSQIRQLLLAGNVYATDHKGDWPDTLEAIEAAGEQKIPLEDPKTGKARFEYHHWSADEFRKLDAARTPVIWETNADPRDHIPVGFADGHVELVYDHRVLEEMLQEADQQLHGK